ncbi:MAG: hypothetical protein ABFS86_08355, partial [Planctomycetota bacterium]
MRMLTWGLAGLAVLFLVPAVASARSVELQSGQKVTAAFDGTDDVHVYRFEALEEDLVSLSFAVPKKSELEPVIELVGPTSEFEFPPLENGKAKLDGLVIEETGLHCLLVHRAGTRGSYKIKFKQKHAKVEPERRKVPGKYYVWLPAGAKAKITVKAEKGSDLHPGIDSIVDPLGNEILDRSTLREKKGKATAKIDRAACLGYYTVYLAAREGTGQDVIGTAKFKPAKAWTKKLTQKTWFESHVSARRTSTGPDTYRYDIVAEVRGDSVTSALLRFPADSGNDDVPLVLEGDRLRYTERQRTSQIHTLVVTLANGKVVSKGLEVEFTDDPGRRVRIDDKTLQSSK